MSSIQCGPFDLGEVRGIPHASTKGPRIEDSNNVYIDRGAIRRRGDSSRIGFMRDAKDDPEHVIGFYTFPTSSGDKTVVFGKTRVASISDSGTLNMIPGSAFNGSGSYISSCQWLVGDNNNVYFTDGTVLSNNLGGIRKFSTGVSSQDVFSPIIDKSSAGAATSNLCGAKFIFTVRRRILAISVWEGLVNGKIQEYQQRIRFCSDGDVDLWTPYEGQSSAGYIDLQSNDRIISCCQVDNDIFIFFTRSIYVITPTDSSRIPFRATKVNTGRVTNSPRGSIALDRNIYMSGQRGMVSISKSQYQTATFSRIDETHRSFFYDDVFEKRANQMFWFKDFHTSKAILSYPSKDSIDNDKMIVINDDDKPYFTRYTHDMTAAGYGTFKSATFGRNRKNTDIVLIGNSSGEVSVFDVDVEENSTEYSVTIGGIIPKYSTQESSEYTRMDSCEISFDMQHSEYQQFNVDFYGDGMLYKTALGAVVPPGIRGIIPINNIFFLPTAIVVDSYGHGYKVGDSIDLYVSMLPRAPQVDGRKFSFSVGDENTLTAQVDLSGLNLTYYGGGALSIDPLPPKPPFLTVKLFNGALAKIHSLRIYSDESSFPLAISGVECFVRNMSGNDE